MSLSNNYPTQRPSLNLDFANGGDQLDSRISYSRASTGTEFSSERHLSSENTQTNSDSLSDWLVNSDSSGPTATLAGGQVGPDGTATNAAIVTGIAGTSLKGIWESFQNIEQTISWYAKEGTHRYIQLSVTGDSSKFVNFDLNGAGAKVANGSGVTASITASANGYLRCAVKLTIPDTYVYITLQDSLGAGRENQTSSTGTVYLHGIQATTLGDTTNLAAYVATTSQIHREFAPTLKTSAADAPRFEYNPATGNSEGLLVEQQSTNLTVSSQQAENWSPQEATVQANVGISPDGSLGADKLTESTTAASTHWIYKSTALGVSVGSTVYSVSFYAKAAGRTEFQTYDNAQNTSGNLHVNLANGTITSGTGVIKSCGDGWYRISYQATADAGTTSVVRILMQDAGSITYDGDGYSGILLWGMQVEIGTAPTSYIKTATSATATRAADYCSVAVSDFAGFADTEGTLFVEGRYNNTDASSTSVALQSADEYVKASLNQTNDSVYAYVRGSGLDQAYINSGSVSGDKLFKVALRYDVNNVGISLNGGAAATDTSATMPIGMTTLHIGRSSSTWDVLNGNLKRVSYYSAPLSDTNLTALTS